MPKINIFITNDDGYVGPTSQMEISEQELQLFLVSSIERVINSSLTIIESQSGPKEHEYTYINLEDWDDWKPLVVMLWNYIHSSACQYPFKPKKSRRMLDPIEMWLLAQAIIERRRRG